MGSLNHLFLSPLLRPPLPPLIQSVSPHDQDTPIPVLALLRAPSTSLEVGWRRWRVSEGPLMKYQFEWWAAVWPVLCQPLSHGPASSTDFTVKIEIHYTVGNVLNTTDIYYKSWSKWRDSRPVLYFYTWGKFGNTDPLIWGQVRHCGGGGGELLVQFLDILTCH